MRRVRGVTGPADVDAFVTRCAPHLRPAFNLALLLTGSPETAADRCEAAVVRAFLTARREEASLPLRLAVLQAVCDACRREDPGIPVRGATAAPGGSALQAAIGRLAPPARAAIWLHDCLGLTDDEAAAVCRRPVEAMRADLSGARAALRGLYPPSG